MVPMDFKWAQELGLIRKPAAFMSSICDERGEELLYAGMPISDVFKVGTKREGRRGGKEVGGKEGGRERRGGRRGI